MICAEEGHVYRLSDTCGAEQEISFIKKVNGKMIHDGTTSKEVLAMLIHRMKYLNAKSPHGENSMVIIKLEEALMWLEKGTELWMEQLRGK